MWAIVLVAGIALVMCGTIVWALGQSSVSADATNRLEHSRDRIRQLATDRQDPSSGQPLEDVSAVLRTHIQRTAEGRGEAELGFVGTDAGTELTWVSADNVSFRPEEDKKLLTRVTAQASATDYPVSGLVLQDGSALVSANFTYTLTYQRTVAGSTMTLGGQTASLSADGATVEGTATVKYIGTVVMRIPSGTAGGQIQVVGGERLIQSVTLDSSSKPD